MKILGVVPARGGSKGILRKNLADLLGKPLLYYTAEACRKSHRLSRAILSSDNDEIRRIGKQLGFDVPFVRPQHLARDDTPSVDVVLHALSSAEAEEGTVYDYVCLLQPTAPLRLASDIDAAVDQLASSTADSIVSVARVEEPHPAKMMRVRDGMAYPLISHEWIEGIRRQDLEPVYFPNGAIYCVRREILVERRSLWGKRTLAYIMPTERSINIDTPRDLMVAALVLREMGEK